MDPNANLREQRKLVDRLHEYIDRHAEYEEMTDAELQCIAANALELATLVEALDTWISRGGFLPAAWTNWKRE